jgi:3,5-epimerase/4-reductase
MKILFFGCNGWIGKQFTKYLNDIDPEIEIIVPDIRADDEKEVEEAIIKYSPTHLISFIGRTHGADFNTIDYLEQPGKLFDNVRDNLYAPMVLASLSIKYKLHLTYLGTGCIFSKSDPNEYSYLETDKPDFFGSSYSIVKGFTDRLMHLYEDNVLNLRIRMPIVNYDHHRSFITKIVNYDKICSYPNSMTVLDDFFPIIYDMMKNKTLGTFNMTNPDVISHNEILEMYKEIVDPEFTWNNFSIEEQNKILKAQRSNNHLSEIKLLNLYPSIPSIKDSVRNCLIKMKERKENIED